MKHFSIVIPTLNEADNIQPLLLEISEVAQQNGMEPEIIFVDDNSTDLTRQQIKDYKGNLKVRLIERDAEQGLASAVVAGAWAASNEFLVVMDADLSHPPSAISALLEPLDKNTHDMVVGSRFVEGGETPNWPLIRRLASQFARIPARFFTSAHDPLSGFFAVSRERLQAVDSSVAGFKIGLEILAKAGCDFRVQEVPITFADRQNGYSKMNMTILTEYLCQLCRLGNGHSFLRTMPLLIVLGLITGLLDYACFSLFTNLGYPVVTSHIGSLLVATHISYAISLFFHRATTSAPPLYDYAGFLTMTLLVLFARGGLFFQTNLSQQIPTAQLAPILITTSCTAWLVAIITVRTGTFQLENPKKFQSLATLLIGYAVLLHLIFLGSTELIQEEAYYWNYAQHMATGYLDHPPVVALLIKLGTQLFGNNEFGVRSGALACWLVTTFFVVKLTTLIFSKEVAFRAVLLVAILPIFFGSGLLITPDAPLIACWAGALYFLYRALIQNISASWYGAGVCIGIGLASKYTMILLGPAIVLYMLVVPSARKWFSRPQPYIAAILAWAIFSPVIWWNYQHDWASFLFQSQERLQAKTIFSTHKLLGSVIALLTPTGLLAVYASMRPQFAWQKTAGAVHLNTSNRNYLFCLLMALVPLSVFVLFSLTKQIKLNWTGPLWLSILPFMAYTMVHKKGRLQGWVAGIWPGTMVILAISYGALLHYSALGLPGTPFANDVFLFGWDDFAQQIEKQVQVLADQRGERPLVVGMDKYRIASGLAFYRNKQRTADLVQHPIDETTGSHLFGRKALMYSYWLPPAQADGRDIFVISRNKVKIQPPYFKNKYRDLDEIHEITIKKQGKDAGHYYYRLLTSYIPKGQASQTSRYTPGQSAIDNRELYHLNTTLAAKQGLRTQ